MMTLPPLLTPSSRVVRRAALALLVGIVAACADDGRLPARFDTETYTIAVGAINGTPLGAPAALSTYDARTVRLDGAYNFDVAFDIDGAGRPVVIPQPLVGTPSGTSRPVGLQRLGSVFDAVTMAPKASAGWVYDSAFTVAIGDVVGVQSRPTACAYDFDPFVYSKVRIDSVSTTRRQLYATVLTNPNCGYRSLVAGRPAN